MRLFAISDLHLGSVLNQKALEKLESRPEDWLILAGDIGETVDHLKLALEILVPKFKQLVWVPGNHDLWTIDPVERPLRGEDKYRRLVEICRQYGVLTPEDPYAEWPGELDGEAGSSGKVLIAPLFLLYDYSFRPSSVAQEEVLEWADAFGGRASDEELLDAIPHRSREEWCTQRVQLAEAKLEAAAAQGHRLVLINHWPLREDLLTARKIGGFSAWCGTTQTEDWHTRFNAEAVVYGHLHLSGTQIRDGVRFEEVSLGYPSEWDSAVGVDAYMRQILPAPEVQQVAST